MNPLRCYQNVVAMEHIPDETKITTPLTISMQITSNSLHNNTLVTSFDHIWRTYLFYYYHYLFFFFFWRRWCKPQIYNYVALLPLKTTLLQSRRHLSSHQSIRHLRLLRRRGENVARTFPTPVLKVSEWRLWGAESGRVDHSPITQSCVLSLNAWNMSLVFSSTDDDDKDEAELEEQKQEEKET